MASAKKVENRIRTLKARGLELSSTGRHAEAAAVYVELTQLDPDDGDWARRAADCFWQLKDDAARLTYCKKAAQAYGDSGHLLKAIAMSKIVLSLDPEERNTSKRLAEMYAKRTATVAERVEYAERPRPPLPRAIAAPVAPAAETEPQEDDAAEGRQALKARARLAAAAALRAIRARRQAVDALFESTHASSYEPTAAAAVSTEQQRSTVAAVSQFDHSQSPTSPYAQEQPSIPPAEAESAELASEPTSQRGSEPAPALPLREESALPLHEEVLDLPYMQRPAARTPQPQAIDSIAPLSLSPASPRPGPVSPPLYGSALPSLPIDRDANAPSLPPNLLPSAPPPPSAPSLAALSLRLHLPGEIRGPAPDRTPGSSVYSLSLPPPASDTPPLEVEAPSVRPFTLSLSGMSEPSEGPQLPPVTPLIPPPVSLAPVSNDTATPEAVLFDKATRQGGAGPEQSQAALYATESEEPGAPDFAADAIALETSAGAMALNAAFGQVPLFSDLAQPLLLQLISDVALVQLDPGELLFEQGSLADAMFVVVDGLVAAEAELDGEVVEWARLSDGEFFGEIGLLSDQPRQARVRALEATSLLRIERQAILHLMEADPSFLASLMAFLRNRLVTDTMLVNPLFAPFDEEDKKHLADRFEFLEIEGDTVLLKPGERSPGMYVLLTGEALQLWPNSPGGLRHLSPGAIFGEGPLLTGAPASSEVRTVGKCFALFLPTQTFRELIMTHPTVLEYVASLPGEPAPGPKLGEHVTLF